MRWAVCRCFFGRPRRRAESDRGRQYRDPERIGIVGADGGGFATWITTALDPDVKAAIVVDDTTDFQEHIRYFRSLEAYELDDQCGLVPGIYRYANQHELLALVAPRPVLIAQSTADEEYPISGARAVYQYGTEIYATLHKRRGIAFVEDEDHGRGFQKSKREAAYGWFVRWLGGGDADRPIEEPETVVEAADSTVLAALPDGRAAPAEPGVKALVARLAVAAQRSGEFRPDKVLDERLPKFPCRWGGRIGHITRYSYFTQRGIRIPLFALRPGPIGASPANGVLVAIDDRGKDELVSDSIVREAVEKRGWQVWILDPQGIGEMRSAKADWVYRTSLLMGEDYLWRQAEDIRHFVECADYLPSHIVGLYARGPNASLAAAYAMATARPQPEFAVFRNSFLSFREILQQALSNASPSAASSSGTDSRV